MRTDSKSGGTAAAVPVTTATLTAAEEKFERWRRTSGFVAGPATFLLLWLLPMPSLSTEAHRLAAIVSFVVIWWVTEAVPIPVTALIGTALTVVCGIANAQEAFAPFATPVIFLFVGGFMIGQAISVHQLDRRLAHAVLSSSAVRGRVSRVPVAIGCLTIMISAWISNTATTAMVTPIALAVLTALRATDSRSGKSFAARTLLTVAYGAAIGGSLTPVGAPHNLVALGSLDRMAGIRVGFLTWVLLCTPISIVMALALFTISAWCFPISRAAVSDMALDAIDVRPQGKKWTAGERNCVIAFCTAATLWVLPGVLAAVVSADSPIERLVRTRLDEGAVAIIAAGLLFMLPTDWSQRKFTLGWKEATRIDWGTILLLGGGLSLGRLMFSTGLAKELGTQLIAVSGAQSLWAITTLAVGAAVLLTQLNSNTATTSMLAPLVISICTAAGVSPVPPTVGVAVGASIAYLLPISMPPNAIVYGSGLIPITSMMKLGALLDLVGFIVVVVGLRLLCPLLGLA